MRLIQLILNSDSRFGILHVASVTESYVLTSMDTQVLDQDNILSACPQHGMKPHAGTKLTLYMLANMIIHV